MKAFSLPPPCGERRDGGLDLGLGAGYRREWPRVGGELRYTYFGGYDTSRRSYRVDIGPLASFEPIKRGAFALQLGLRGLLSRAGTYRRTGAVLGKRECDFDFGHCTSDGEEVRRVPFVAYYGFSAGLDLTFQIRSWFVRLSALRTRWYWAHELPVPKNAPADRIERYRARISGPLLDRFDIHIALKPVEARTLREGECGESSREVAARVTRVRALRETKGLGASPQSLTDRCHADSLALLDRAVDALGLSVRAYMKALRVAHTIAALEESVRVEAHHMAEAIQYRLLHRAEKPVRPWAVKVA